MVLILRGQIHQSFSFFASGFWIIFRKAFCTFQLQRDSAMCFFSNTCIISFYSLHLKIFDYLEIIVYSVRIISNFIFFHITVQLFKHCLLKCPSLPNWVAIQNLLHTKFIYMIVSISRFPFWSIVLYVHSCTNSIILIREALNVYY